jgi:AraC family transcriptional regulator, regulatory protein of adaptative response / DNA-3-methyladenine glycosylase II
LLAKQLLTDSTMPVTSVAMASGFQSLRRFNALIKERYRLSPTEFRKQQKRELPRNFSEFAFRLNYRPPLDWDGLLGFLAPRAIPHVEAVQDGAYLRTVHVKRQGSDHAGYVRVCHERHTLSAGGPGGNSNRFGRLRGPTPRLASAGQL